MESVARSFQAGSSLRSWLIVLEPAAVAVSPVVVFDEEDAMEVARRRELANDSREVVFVRPKSSS